MAAGCASFPIRSMYSGESLSVMARQKRLRDPRSIEREGEEIGTLRNDESSFRLGCTTAGDACRPRRAWWIGCRGLFGGGIGVEFSNIRE